jgi:hypothetical protein
MPDMISKVAHVYAGRQLSAGERFHADKEFVAALIGLGRAEPAPMESQVEEIQTRDMVAAEPAVYQTRDVTSTARQKRKYARRQSA